MVSPRSKDPLSLRHQEINSRVFRPQTSSQISKPNLLARVVVARTNPSCLDQFQVGFPSLQWLHKHSSTGSKMCPCHECVCGSLAEENCPDCHQHTVDAQEDVQDYWDRAGLLQRFALEKWT